MECVRKSSGWVRGGSEAGLANDISSKVIFYKNVLTPPLTYNGAMCSGRHVRQDKLFFNKNVSNVGPNNCQFWRFALKQFSHDLKKFRKELKDNYFSYFEHIHKYYKQTKKKQNWSLAVFEYHLLVWHIIISGSCSAK